ncbi:FadR/GntR family transcriptional regulator [Sphaerisporangium fuscum]|uniref:FadR/GntR family transcriptional regulator n=1 Tax=Sphaerisporangium fuscum TaxID=2835868 RepID=UPI001BDCFE1E|nr:FCD domain-containing protein [Sphaerisporangium fuscum]
MADKERRTRAFEEVLFQIERRITDDGLRVGDRLPGERQLAEQLQVSRASVREALRVLETLGVLSSQVGRGPDAGAVLTSRPDSALTDLLRLSLGLSSLTMREVVDTRLMIERWSAEQAARRAALAPSGLKAVTAAMLAMEAATGAEEFVRHDMAFHAAIAEASGNRFIAAVMRALRGAMRRYAIEAVERLGDTAVLREDHRRIHAAITTGDAAAAVEAVTAHLAHAYPELF